jgi:hypothetical protein
VSTRWTTLEFGFGSSRLFVATGIFASRQFVQHVPLLCLSTHGLWYDSNVLLLRSWFSFGTQLHEQDFPNTLMLGIISNVQLCASGGSCERLKQKFSYKSQRDFYGLRC